jgi:hypothetical protein
VADAAASDVVGTAAPAGTVAVAAPRQVVVSDKGLRLRDQFLAPRGMSPGQGLVCVFQGCMPEKAGSLRKDRACDLEEGASESGRVCVPQGMVLHWGRHGSLSASRPLGHDGTCYKNSGHNADPHSDRANRGISG